MPQTINSSTGFDSQSFLATLTNRPGVYRMLDGEGQVLYVGKAKDLKRRVGSYFARALGQRLQAMISQVAAIEVTVTHTEAEALLLENNLIKSLRPRYNILFRDDKSYPYIHLSADAFPRLGLHRGARSQGGRYFGPYPSTSATRETLYLMQKLFLLRQCEDNFYRNRSRPCMQYQIKRCSAPCVDLISTEEYGKIVRQATLFLDGKGRELTEEWVRRMDEAAARLEYEQAARYRDQIANLSRIQERQYVYGESGDLDILACCSRAGSACVQVFFIRQGRNLGNKAFFPQLPAEMEPPEVLAAFLGQYYLEREVPWEILVSHLPANAHLLEQMLSHQAGHRVGIKDQVRGARSHWLQMAEQNAELALEARLAGRAGVLQRLEALQEALGLEERPERIECYDVSHTSGEQTVAACVVFDRNGPLKTAYRRFNINGLTPGDDYGAMEQVIQRRYTRLRNGEGETPDLLLIDGGKGQLAAAGRALMELGFNDLILLGIAKGPDRRPGQEQLFLSGSGEPLILPPNSPALHLIQQIRDEAHRFAITGHRQRRQQGRMTSTLEQITGVGPKRRQLLLKHFGGLQGLSRAGVEDLCRVKGISRQLAQQIYDGFHGLS